MTEPIDMKKAREARADRRQLVPCAHCGRDIPMLVSRCPRCGVHFQGAAFQFDMETDRERAKSSLARRVLIAVGGIALAVTLGLLLVLSGR